MTSRERVHQALKFQETDIVPYQVDFTYEAYRKLVERCGDPNVIAGIGNHLAGISLRESCAWEEIEPGHWRDEWGVVWNQTVDKDIGVIENYVIPEPSLKGFECPPVRLKAMSEIYSAFVEQNPDKFRLPSIGFLLFERAWTLRGMENLLQDMLENPGFVHDLLDKITEWSIAQVELAVKYDVDGIRFGDDWGSQRGLIMGPHLWREFIKPRIAKLYKRVRNAGKYVIIHSCGDVKEVFPDLVEVGLNVFNPFQPEVMDVFEIKKQYYGKLSFYGGISVQRLLPYGTPDEVRRETRRLLKELGKGGGYIASPSHAIPSDVPVENIIALVETLQNQ